MLQSANLPGNVELSSTLLRRTNSRARRAASGQLRVDVVLARKGRLPLADEARAARLDVLLGAIAHAASCRATARCQRSATSEQNLGAAALQDEQMPPQVRLQRLAHHVNPSRPAATGTAGKACPKWIIDCHTHFWCAAFVFPHRLARSLRHRHRLVPRLLRRLLHSTILWMATMPSTSSSARTPRRPPLRLLEPQREEAASTTTTIRLHLRGCLPRTTTTTKRRRTSSITASATASATATVSLVARSSARPWRSPRARCGTLWLNESRVGT